MIKRIAAVAALLLGLAVTAGCAPYVSPCTRLAPPSAQELEVAQTGVEIERETEGVECDLINGQWVEEEESYSSGSHSKPKPKTTAARSTTKPKKP